MVFGAAVLIALNVLAVLMRRDPETMGLRTDGAPAIGASTRSGLRTGGWTVAQALRSRAFWMLYGVFAAAWTPVFIPLVHLVPMARGLGIAPLLAATLVSAVGVAAMAGRLVMGAASDRIGRRAALAVAFVLQAAAFVGFAWSHDLAALYTASVVFGFSSGAASTLFTATVADFFGREHAASLAGLLFSLAGSMAACGPFAAGFIYDRAGDYHLAWWLSAACNGLALFLLVFTRPPAPRDEAAAA